MTHHITDEQIFAVADEHADGGHGPVGEPANWYGFEQKSLLEFTRAVLALAAPAQQGEPFGFFRATAFGWEDCAAGDEGAIALYTAPAPAVPSDVLSEMREFGKAKMAEFMGAHHMALVLSQKINEWADKLTAAPTPPAQGEPVGCPDCRAAWPAGTTTCPKCGGTLTDEAAPTPPAQIAPVQLGELAKRNVYDAIRGAYDLGYNDARNARAVPGDSAPGYEGRNVEADHGGALLNSLNQRLRNAPAQPAVPEDVARDASIPLADLRKLVAEHLGGELTGFDVTLVRAVENWHAQRRDAARAAEKGGTA